MSILSLVRSRVFIALLVLAAALTVAAACNGDDNGDGTPVGGETPANGETPASGETPAADGSTAEIKMLPGNTFDRGELVIAADADVTVTADNTDGTHSFAVYQEEGGDLIGETEICGAPCVDSVTLNLAAGEYFFRCEVHPSVMTGTVIAQ